MAVNPVVGRGQCRSLSRRAGALARPRDEIRRAGRREHVARREAERDSQPLIARRRRVQVSAWRATCSGCCSVPAAQVQRAGTVVRELPVIETRRRLHEVVAILALAVVAGAVRLELIDPAFRSTEALVARGPATWRPRWPLPGPRGGGRHGGITGTAPGATSCAGASRDRDPVGRPSFGRVIPRSCWSAATRSAPCWSWG